MENNSPVSATDPTYETSMVAAGFDLALQKKLGLGETSAVAKGDTVEYVITVINQGMEDAYNIEIHDYLPHGMTFDPLILENQINGWFEYNGNPTRILDSLPSGWTFNLKLHLLVDHYNHEACMTNIAEITKADNDRDPDNTPPVDIDSEMDYDPDNDVVEDDFIDNYNGDEDDHDIEKVYLCINLAANDDLHICKGDTAVLGTNGGAVFAWSPADSLDDPGAANPLAFPDSTTMYYVTITDATGCSQVDSQLVTVNQDLLVDAGPDVRICENEVAQLQATGGSFFSWTPSATLSCDDCSNPVAYPDTTTTYYVTSWDDIGCENTDSITVTVGAEFLADAGNPGTICLGQTTVLVASGGIQYEWTPQLGLDNPFAALTAATPLETTTYTVKVTNANGCMDTDTVTVYVNPVPEPDLGDDQSICIGDSIQLHAGPGDIFAWSPPDGLSCTNCPDPWASPANDITYTVTVTNEFDCEGRDHIFIEVRSFDEADARFRCLHLSRRYCPTPGYRWCFISVESDLRIELYELLQSTGQPRCKYDIYSNR